MTKWWPSATDAALLGVMTLAGCASPFVDQGEVSLRKAVIASTQRQMLEAAASAAPVTLSRQASELRFDEDRINELNAMSPNLSSAGADTSSLGENLLGKPIQTAALSLERAVQMAVANNLDAQVASIQPAITAAQTIAAEAAFDWTLFASFNYSRTEQESPIPVIQGVPIGSAINRNQTFAYATGLRRAMASGGTLTISQGLDVFNNKSPGVQRFPDPTRTASLDITLAQPILRNFGADVNRAQIRLSRNAERNAVQALKAQLLRAVTDTENAYWSLTFAVQELRIRERLLARGVETRDVLKGRLGFDVRPAEFSDAVARVESRRGDVIRSRNRVLQASDLLKSIINDPEVTVGSETLLVPLDTPIDAPITFGVLDSIATSLNERPEIQQAILAIDDATIREQVAENAKLPLLDLSFQAKFGGLGDAGDRAYSQLFTGNFVDYILGANFEQPIGNRLAEAQYRQRRLERLAAVVAHRNAVQGVLLDVKTTLRDLTTAYKLIEQTRTARLAAAENLRTLRVEEENIRALTPDFLDLKLTRQEALAQAELQETQALIEYNTALASYFAAIGSALKRNHIEFVVPDVSEDAIPRFAGADRAASAPPSAPG